MRKLVRLCSPALAVNSGWLGNNERAGYAVDRTPKIITIVQMYFSEYYSPAFFKIHRNHRARRLHSHDQPHQEFHITACASSFLAACASEQPKQSVQPAPAAASAPSPAPQVEAAPQPAVQVYPLHDPNNILSKRSVYYDFDKSDIKPEFRPLIEAHAKYLRITPVPRLQSRVTPTSVAAPSTT